MAISHHIFWAMIAYVERCLIHVLQRRFSFGGPDLITQELLCSRVIFFFLVFKGTEKASDIDFRRGTDSAPTH